MVLSRAVKVLILGPGMSLVYFLGDACDACIVRVSVVRSLAERSVVWLKDGHYNK